MTRIHFVHVGNMNNKGTQALFKSDVQVVSDLLKDVVISVSTTDIEGVKRLGLPLKAILPPMVDIPYERADALAKRRMTERRSLRYRGSTLAMLIYMLIQIPLTLISVILAKIGLKALYRSEVVNYVKNCDLVISHSDESFKEAASLLPLNLTWIVTWWSMLLSRTWEILVARSVGKPVVLFPNSVGPFRTFVGRLLGRLSLGQCSLLVIRDPVSYEIVRRLGITSSKTLTYDTALLFKTTKGKDTCRFRKPVVGVSPGMYSNSLGPRELDDYILAHSRALDKCIEEHGVSVVFLPHYISGFPLDDLEICRMILERMVHKDRAEIVETESVDEFKCLLDQMDMIVSSKMHPAVLGVSGFVPVLCIAYDHKQTGFFSRLKMEQCTIEIGSLSYTSLHEKMNYVWNNRNELSTLLRKTVPFWQSNVANVIKKAICLYTKTQ